MSHPRAARRPWLSKVRSLFASPGEAASRGRPRRPRLAVVLLECRVVPATLLFQDVFNAPNSADVNSGAAARQAGPYAPARYLEDPSTAAGGALDALTQVGYPGLPNTLLLATQAGNSHPFTYVSPDADFAGAGLSRLHVAISPLGPDSTVPGTDHWAGVVFGTTPGAFITGGGTGVLVRASGLYEVWDRGAMVSIPGAGVPPKNDPLNMFQKAFYAVDVTVDPATGRFTVFINNVQVYAGGHGGPYATNAVTLEDFTAAGGVGTQLDFFDDLAVSGSPPLFNDPFDTAANSADVNLGVATRQTGRTTNVTYAEDPATASGGAVDALTQVGYPHDPNTLLLAPQAGTGHGFVYASPQLNFGAAGMTHLHVAVDPLGPDSTVPTTDHWAGVVFGAAPGTLLTAGGTGVRIRNSGDYDVWDGGVLKFSGNAGATQRAYAVDVTTDPAGGAYTVVIDGVPRYTGVHAGGVGGTNDVTLESFTAAGDTGTQLDFFDSLAVYGSDAATLTAAPNTAYYVSPDGNDANSGLSPAAAWRTIDRVNHVNFQPGDSILFERGDGVAFAGNLAFDAQDQGQPGAPVTVGSYQGNYADADGRATIRPAHGTGIEVADAGHFVVQDLQVAGADNTLGLGDMTDVGDGIVFLNDQPIRDAQNHAIPHTVYDGVEAQRVEVSNFGLVGVHVVGWYTTAAIVASSVHHNGTGGVGVEAPSDPDPNARFDPDPNDPNNPTYVKYVTSGVYVGSVQADHNAGARVIDSGYGVYVYGANEVVVDQCIANDNGIVGGVPGNVKHVEPPGSPEQVNVNGGIQAIACERVLLQHNQAFHNVAQAADGDGVVLDSVRGGVMQFNFTHDNDGGGLYLGAEPNSPSGPSYNNTVRYNVSENDGRYFVNGGLYITGDVEGANVYGNTVYLAPRAPGYSPRAIGPAINFDATSHGASVHVWNNIFYTADNSILVVSLQPGWTNVFFQGNDYYAGGGTPRYSWNGAQPYSGLAAWRAATGQEILDGQGTPTGTELNPQLVDPGHGSTDPNAYRLSAAAPPQVSAGGLDFGQTSASGWDPYGFAADPFIGQFFSTQPSDFYGGPLPAPGSGPFSMGADQFG